MATLLLCASVFSSLQYVPYLKLIIYELELVLVRSAWTEHELYQQLLQSRKKSKLYHQKWQEKWSINWWHLHASVLYTKVTCSQNYKIIKFWLKCLALHESVGITDITQIIFPHGTSKWVCKTLLFRIPYYYAFGGKDWLNAFAVLTSSGYSLERKAAVQSIYSCSSNLTQSNTMLPEYLPKSKGKACEECKKRKLGHLFLLLQMWIVQESHQLIPFDGKFLKIHWQNHLQRKKKKLTHSWHLSPRT